ncbi:class I SAM-dependent methyltransferase [Saccharothrix sp. Mg75]|uniref:class I SAM-dependent methyltransferase n=1 Tax=Saccharothrix sp. Mg75 TaxID=3445357 RepID=UPI003EEDBC89
MSQTAQRPATAATRAPARRPATAHMGEDDLDAVFDADYEHFMRHSHPRGFNRAEADLAMRVAGLRAGASVLDAACGYGRVARELAARGVRVHGVDRSPTLIASARADAARDGTGATFEVADLRRFEPEPEHDAALLWFTSFGYGDDEDSRLVLRTLCRSLRPGGRLLIDTVHPVHEHARAVADNHRVVLRRAGDDLMLDEVSLDAAGTRITGARTLVRDGRTRSCTWSLRLVGLAEYERWLRDAGFAGVAFLGPDGGPADWAHQRLLVLAHA